MKHSTSFKQELVGVFGDPVAENPTQAMIEAAFAEIGMDWRYLTVEVKAEALGDAVKGARAMNWKGFNCTIPHKVAVVPLLDRLNPAAKIIGAVNCVINRHGELVGDNNDGKGFLRSLAGIHAIRGLRAVILERGARHAQSRSSWALHTRRKSRSSNALGSVARLWFDCWAIVPKPQHRSSRGKASIRFLKTLTSSSMRRQSASFRTWRRGCRLIPNRSNPA